MAEEMRVHAGGVGAGLRCQAAEDEEGSRARQRAALGVEEELGPMPLVQEGPAAGEIPPHGLDALASERDDPLLVSLAEAAHDAVVKIDPPTVEPHGLAHPEPGSVEELDERPVAECAWGRPVRGLDEAFDLTGRQRAGETRAAARKVELGRRVVVPSPEEDEVVVEGS
jgi:hypothetical protein